MRRAKSGPSVPDRQYEGFFAEFYDILHGSYDADIPFYLDLARANPGSILELGCGSGRLLLPLAEAGHAVTGIDGSPDMLARCSDRLLNSSEPVRARVRLEQGDMFSFSLGRKFRLVLAACNTILHCVTTDQLLALMRCAREHLEPGGLFVVDFNLPNVKKMLEADGNEEVFTITHPEKGTRLVDTYRADYDFTHQVETIHMRIEEFSGTTLLRVAESSTRRAFYFPREVTLALRSEGYRVVRTWTGYRHGRLVESTRDVVLICQPVHDGE
ncbi:MAG: dTDP-3-amino-3,4,6-trideoxy-alpha-D-glucopyranose [Firmicutes bacterium ADurb.Bin506]|nr:MAG: dTDP-3-amino-3,4,6-trideoxy-alpha-D-glucopyranose [Firmicutes bacterium ADurb.Bin506]